MKASGAVVDVYVVGGGLPELAAALELAEVGLSVRVADWQVLGDTSAAVRAHARSVAGPTAAVPDPEGALRGLLEHLAAPVTAGDAGDDGVRPVEVLPAATLLPAAKGGWVRQPLPAVVGIPAVPVASEAVAVLGRRQAARAYLDRLKPVLTIGKTHALGELVRTRLGDALLEKLVQPFVRERFGVSAEDVDVAVAVPGLNEALTRVGSLSGAVLANEDRDVARETRVVPRDGWAAAMVALRERLAFYGVQFSQEPVSSVSRGASGDGWSIEEGGDDPVRARALVAGIDAGTTAEALSVLPAREPDAHNLTALLPDRWRIESSVRVEGGTAESVRQQGLDALQLVNVHAPDLTAAVRVTEAGEAPPAAVALDDPAPLPGPQSSMRAVVSGSAFDMEADRHGMPEESDLEQRLDDALSVAGLERSAEAGAIFVLRVAPEISAEHRDAAVERLEAAREEQRDLLVVGEALHRGDLPDAVADARTQGILLRRRLTGISD